MHPRIRPSNRTISSILRDELGGCERDLCPLYRRVQASTGSRRQSSSQPAVSRMENPVGVGMPPYDELDLY